LKVSIVSMTLSSKENSVMVYYVTGKHEIKMEKHPPKQNKMSVQEVVP